MDATSLILLAVLIVGFVVLDRAWFRPARLADRALRKEGKHNQGPLPGPSSGGFGGGGFDGGGGGGF